MMIVLAPAFLKRTFMFLTLGKLNPSLRPLRLCSDALTVLAFAVEK